MRLALPSVTALALTLAFGLFSLPGHVRAQTVSGRVFVDANQNGRYDEGEAGIPGVPVSDGVTFAATAADGRYTTDAGVDPVLQPNLKPIVTVSFPSGYWPTAGWFRRIAQPEDAANADFALREDEQPLPFTFIHGTDPHVPRSGKDKFIAFRSEVSEMTSRVRFCVITGDMVDGANSDPYRKAKADYDFLAQQTEDFPVPLFCVPGNHDPAGVNNEKDWDKADPNYGYAMFCSYVGPMRWSFNYAGIHFVGIDYSAIVDGKWTKAVPSSAVKWLEKDLQQVKPGSRIFLFVHYINGAPELERVVGEYGVTQVFAGHSHLDETLTCGGVPCVISSSVAQIQGAGGQSPSYRFAHVTENGLEMFLKATGQPHSISVDHPRQIEVLRLGDAIRGGFFDQAGTIKTLTVELGGAGGEVPFERGPICCTFQARLDLADVVQGNRTLEVSVSDGNRTWQYRRNYLVLTGKDADFPAEADAELDLDLGGIDTAAELVLNGEPLAKLAPTKLKGDGPFKIPVKGTEVVKLAIAKDRLRRLNDVELRAVKADGTQPDAFCVLDARLRYSGKVFRDISAEYGSSHPRSVREKTSYWIDLSPDKFTPVSPVSAKQ